MDAAALRNKVGTSVAPRTTWERACEITKHLQGGSRKLPSPITQDMPIGETGVDDLNMTPLEGSRQVHTRHLVDIVDDLPEDINWGVICNCMKRGDMDGMSAPFSPKAALPTPFCMQLILTTVKSGDDAFKMRLVKHFVFEDPVPVVSAGAIGHGQTMLPNFGTNPRGGPRALQFLLDRLGGCQVRYYSFEKAASGPMVGGETIDNAYDFILEKAPRSEDTTLHQSRWVKKQLNNAESPIVIAGLNESDIWSAIKKIREMEVQAAPIVGFPFFIQDLEDWYVNDILDKVAHLWKTNPLLMLGVSGVGKTPALQVIMSCVSRWHKKRLEQEDWMRSEMRVTSCFDFFRLEKGRIDRPDSLDDSDLNEQPMSKLKAFFDMSLDLSGVHLRTLLLSLRVF